MQTPVIVYTRMKAGPIRIAEEVGKSDGRDFTPERHLPKRRRPAYQEDHGTPSNDNPRQPFDPMRMIAEKPHANPRDRVHEGEGGTDQDS